MLDLEQQANQAPALASHDDDWHLLEGERTTFAIFLLPFARLLSKARGRPWQGDATPLEIQIRQGGEGWNPRSGIWRPLLSSDKFEETAPPSIRTTLKAMRNFIYI